MHARSRILLRDLRGDTSTHHLSTRLGYPSDVVAEWEAGRRWPTASELFRVCELLDINVRAALRRFDPECAAALTGVDDAGVAAWLAELCRGREMGTLAAAAGRSRTVIRRWLSGQVRPVLPDLLSLIDAATGRGEDFIQALLPPPPPLGEATDDPEQAAERRSEPARRAVRDALDEAWAIRIAARAGPVEELPADEETVEVFVAAAARDSLSPDDPSEAVWRAVASADYAELEIDRPGWLEARSGLSRDECLDTLHTLETAGCIRRGQDRWHLLRHPPEADPRLQPAPASPIERLARLRSAQVIVPLGPGDLQRCRRLDRRTRAELLAIARLRSGPLELAMVSVIR